MESVGGTRRWHGGPEIEDLRDWLIARTGVTPEVNIRSRMEKIPIGEKYGTSSKRQCGFSEARHRGAGADKFIPERRAESILEGLARITAAV
jgi:hypothetical protein